MENEFNTIEIANNKVQSNEFNSMTVANELIGKADQFNTQNVKSEYTHAKPKQKLKIPIYQLVSTFAVFVVATVSVINVAYPTFFPSIVGETAQEIVVAPSSTFSAINYTYVYDYSPPYPEIKFTFDYKDDLGYWSDYMLVIYHNDITSHVWNGKYLTLSDLENGKVVEGYGGTVGNFRFAVYAATTDPKYESASIFTYTTNISEGEPTPDQLVKFAGYDSTTRALIYITPVITLVGG